ncbi:MAG TPA: DUF748 domain-containing protein [Polyangia bacterium]
MTTSSDKIEAPGAMPPARPAKPRRALRRTFIVLASLAVLLIVFRLVLDPVAAHFTRKALADIDGFKATFSTVHVGLLPPSYEIHDFKVIEDPPAGRWAEPLVYVERAWTSIVWRKVLKGQLVARAVLENPKVVAVRQHEKKAKKSADLGETLQAKAPLTIDRLEIVDGELLIAEGKGKKAPQLWIHKLDFIATNLATRKELMGGERANFNMRAHVQRSGRLEVDAHLDPWTKKPTFDADAKLEKLDARELYAFISEKTEMHPKSGVINLYVKVDAKNGALRGGVKPIIENLELTPSDDDISTRLKTFLADAAVELFTDDIPGRDAVAAVIPIRGSLDQPDVQLVPTILGVVRNAFVVGIRSGFKNVPPPTAEKKEGVLKQAWQALKDDEGPPEAQPDEQDSRRQGRKAAAGNKPARPRGEAGKPQDQRKATEDRPKAD